MLSKLTGLFKAKENPEQLFMQQQQIVLDEQRGYIVDGIVLTELLAERLEYLSNRRIRQFDDLKALYAAAILINEKIDLEIATGHYAAHLGNSAENLQQFKSIVAKLNQYYREFKR